MDDKNKECPFLIFSGRNSKDLWQKICDKLNEKLNFSVCGDIDCENFSDGEIRVKIKNNVRGKEVFVMQSTNPPAENILELLIIIDALKRASAEKITVIIPYYGYARQDRKTKGREPITSKLTANLIEAAGASRVICIDLHAGQIQGFFNVPMDDLKTIKLFAEQIKQDFTDFNNIVIASPDAGGAKRAEKLCACIPGSSLVICHKTRDYVKKDSVNNFKILGEVKDKDVVIIDDVTSTFSTIKGASTEILNMGAKSVSAGITHWACPDEVADNLKKGSDIKNIYITNTCPRASYPISLGVAKEIDISKLISETILCIVNHDSVSKLLD